MTLLTQTSKYMREKQKADTIPDEAASFAILHMINTCNRIGFLLLSHKNCSALVFIRYLKNTIKCHIVK